MNVILVFDILMKIEQIKKSEQKNATEDNWNAINLYETEYDSLHFNIFHLYTTGYRIRKNTNDKKHDENTNDNDNYIQCIDHEFSEMMKTINYTRDKYENIFSRFKTEKNNNKYNINIVNNIQSNKNEKPFMDKIFEYLTSNRIGN
eukprot:37724_1